MFLYLEIKLKIFLHIESLWFLYIETSFHGARIFIFLNIATFDHNKKTKTTSEHRISQFNDLLVMIMLSPVCIPESDSVSDVQVQKEKLQERDDIAPIDVEYYQLLGIATKKWTPS